MDQQELKKQAAAKALQYVRDGMYVGLGTGSTANLFIELLGQKVKEQDMDITCIATSRASFDLARKMGLTLMEALDPNRMLDVTVDGADEIAPNLNLTKGLGGALLMEKIVALHTKYQIIIGDQTKLVEHLGEKSPIPVEVIPFSWQATAQKLTEMGLEPVLRLNGDSPFVTDMGNHILDCNTEPVQDDLLLSQRIKSVTGVVDHGLFINIAQKAIVATDQGIMEMDV